MNAVKHGLDAETLILPGEDEGAFRSRLEASQADFPPRDPLEEALLEEAARLAWRLDRADRAQAAYLAGRIALGQSDEARRQAEAAAEADRIGRRLIDGPPATVGEILGLNAISSGARLGAPIHPDDPAHPERLLHRLESTAAGCRWLLERWAEWWRALQGDGDAGWQPAERLRAVRLLGKQPVDAVDDPMVQKIYLCSFVLASNGPEVFADQAGAMSARQFEYFLQRLAGRRVSESVPPDREAAREGLRELVEGVIARLDARAAEHAARAEREAALAPGRLAFDDDPEGERLRRLQQRLLGSMLRTVDLLMKLRRRPDADVPRPEPAPDVAASPGGPEPCEKLRNEPIAPTMAEGAGARREEEGRPAPSGSFLVPHPAPDAEPARILDATPEESTGCEKVRNEPNAAGPTERLLPARPDPIHVGRAFQSDPGKGRSGRESVRQLSAPDRGPTPRLFFVPAVSAISALVVPLGLAPRSRFRRVGTADSWNRPSAPDAPCHPAGRGPPSPVARPPRFRGIFLGPMSGLALTFVGD